MKNIRKDQLKKAIFLEFEEFQRLLKEVFGKNAGCTCDYVELDYYANNISPDEIHSKLAEYFGVSQITSIHADDCEYIGIWIIYKD